MRGPGAWEIISFSRLSFGQNQGLVSLSSLALPTLSAPACACPDSPGTFVPQKSRLPAPLVDLVLAEQTVLSSGPFLEQFSSATLFFTPLVQDPLPLHLVAYHSL